jgi:hypothetical protein
MFDLVAWVAETLHYVDLVRARESIPSYITAAPTTSIPSKFWHISITTRPDSRMGQFRLGEDDICSSSDSREPTASQSSTARRRPMTLDLNVV